jgi:hypothetical protein
LLAPRQQPPPPQTESPTSKTSNCRSGQSAERTEKNLDRTLTPPQFEETSTGKTPQTNLETSTPCQERCPPKSPRAQKQVQKGRPNESQGACNSAKSFDSAKAETDRDEAPSKEEEEEEE